jgi:hypothetical protein
MQEAPELRLEARSTGIRVPVYRILFTVSFDLISVLPERTEHADRQQIGCPLTVRGTRHGQIADIALAKRLVEMRPRVVRLEQGGTSVGSRTEMTAQRRRLRFLRPAAINGIRSINFRTALGRVHIQRTANAAAALLGCRQLAVLSSSAFAHMRAQPA